MATILLAAAGAAVGAGFGGTVLGLSGAVIGRAVGATLGRAIDQKLLGAGSEAVEVGRVDRFRLMGASEGSAVAKIFGRVRLAGQVIWATRFQESQVTSGGGKGASRPSTTQYSYSVSLAVALCEGRILGVGRIWADGVEIERSSVTLRVYRGGDAQVPDPKIEAVEGEGMAPAYRGIAYVVFEDLALDRFGNRVPQFSFEVIRAAQGGKADVITGLDDAVTAVALIPGTGEYSLATTPVHYSEEPGVNRSANVNSPMGATDLAAAFGQLRRELPEVASVSLVVSWFGSDLRCGECLVQPKVEQADLEGEGMPWRAGGISRSEAGVVVREDGRSIYGGTPSDQSVIESIRAIRAEGREVMFYPFILMEQWRENGLTDPWSGATHQPVLPWRGRITLSAAPGRPGSPDRSAAAEAEVAAFFGTASPSDFSTTGEQVSYSGPQEWRYRRFILHYAHLCAAAGGVDAFCVGSEMVALTQIRGDGDSFPAVGAMRQLLSEVRAILGPEVKLTYAADWTEYFGYHADGNVYFHLDPLWADPETDFIGIDNYMPLSDWRDGEDHADAGWGSVHDLDYLKANIAGGEGYHWYYDSPEAEAAQRRKPIEDGAHGEPWVFRYKDIRNWWSRLHHDRIGGERMATPTSWVPRSKPIRFTEYGCAAIDKGTNQPNKFLDPKSSESFLPKFSDGRRDDLIQMQYLRAMADYWRDPANNPVSPLYPGQMVDFGRAHAWTWDARPFPQFPAALELWGDGSNHARGHWITGRATNQPLEAVVAEICQAAGVAAFDVTALRGVVRGYALTEIQTGRAALQPLMVAHGFDAVERDGVLVFRMRDGHLAQVLDRDGLAVVADLDGDVETQRQSEAEAPGRVGLAFVEAEGSFDLRHVEAAFPDAQAVTVSQNELPMVLTVAEARGITERWLAEARIGRDAARFALPKSALRLGAGDVVSLAGARYRIDRVEIAEAQILDAVRIEPGSYRPSDTAEERIIPRAFTSPAPVFAQFLDLPLLTDQDVPHAPRVAVSARPWPGAVGIWHAPEDEGYEFNRLVTASAVMGRTESILPRGRAGLWDNGPALRVRLFGGALQSASDLRVLNGANAMAIGNGDGGDWEIFQFALAELVGVRTYDLTRRLRGQLGTDAVAGDAWPIGSRVVLLNSAVPQIALAESARGLARHYRIGANARGYDDPNVLHRVQAFDGVGLRPYAPSHLRLNRRADGDVLVTWVRRTRVNGDGWQGVEVPLGEAREEYLVRVTSQGQVLRETLVDQRSWVYPAAAQAADLLEGEVQLSVAQVSDSFGPGPFRVVAVS
jgi:hypothetical protein